MDLYTFKSKHSVCIEYGRSTKKEDPCWMTEGSVLGFANDVMLPSKDDRSMKEMDEENGKIFTETGDEMKYRKIQDHEM